MSYNIAISIINGKPEITSSGGDLPEGAISISGNEPTAGYKMRTLNATLYGAGQSSEYRGSAGISMPAEPAPVQATIDDLAEPDPTTAAAGTSGPSDGSASAEQPSGTDEAAALPLP